MEYKVVKYTIIERYPSILNTKIPLFDIFIGIGYYIWIFLYFIIGLIKSLFKGPKYIKKYISNFFISKDKHKGFPEEKDFKLNANSINDSLDIRNIKEDTEETIVNIFKGKKAFIKLKEVIRENNLYNYIEYLPTKSFILREEILLGNYNKNDILISKGYSIPVYNYISFIYKIKKTLKFPFSLFSKKSLKKKN